MSIENGLWLIDGIPYHPLIVHFTVVLLPLATLLILGSLVLKRVRILDPWILVLQVLATSSAFLTSLAGQNLAVSIGVELEHATPGIFVPAAATLLSVFFSLLIWSRRLDRDGALALWVRRLFWVITALSLLATLMLTVLAGHSGAKSSWDEKVAEVIQP